MEAALRSLIINAPSVTALVSADNVVWGHLPQGANRPAIVLYKISGVPGITLEGGDGLTDGLVQVDIQATSASQMWAIKSAVLALLHGYQGSSLRGIFARAERQTSEELAGTLLHRCSLDFNVWHRA